jgi:hypothetical protein
MDSTRKIRIYIFFGFVLRPSVGPEMKNVNNSSTYGFPPKCQYNILLYKLILIRADMTESSQLKSKHHKIDIDPLVSRNNDVESLTNIFNIENQCCRRHFVLKSLHKLRSSTPLLTFWRENLSTRRSGRTTFRSLRNIFNFE